MMLVGVCVASGMLFRGHETMVEKSDMLIGRPVF